MPVTQVRSETGPKAFASNGARLVSPSGEVLPLRDVRVLSSTTGGFARTTLRQEFANSHSSPLELVYSFPLPADGAVVAYEIRAGIRAIHGRIDRRDDARAQFEAARLEGRTAGLVEQERTNFFTQRLGNIPAMTDVIVDLTIDHPLAWISGGSWEWRFPTVIAPRFLGNKGTVPDAEAVTVDVLNGSAGPSVSLALTINDDVVTAPTSSTHTIVVADRTVGLTGKASLDRDIVVRWGVPRLAPGCVLSRARPRAVQGADDSAFGLLTIVPPAQSAEIFARDLVLLLDVSGSMSGRPLDHLKAVVTALIDSLTDADRLEMIAFSSTQVRFRTEPVQTTATERRRALAWVSALKANGGTELIPAISEALRPLRDDVVRQVVVVTDGLIGFESAAIRAIRDGLPPRSRLHTIGIGPASNRAFLRPAARAGRGVEVLIGLDDSAAEGAERITAATREPILTNVVLEGTALDAPVRTLPDLLAGSPVLSTVRLRPEGGMLTVRGATVLGDWEEHVEVPSTQPGEGSESIPALWARETIEALELDLACGGEQRDIDRRIEEIALRHSVLSRLTSWVAIAEEPSVDPREPVRTERIPQALPYGMSAEGLGLGAVPPSAAVRMCWDAVIGSSTVAGYGLESLAPLRSSVPIRQQSRDVELRRIAQALETCLEQVHGISSNAISRLRDQVTALDESIRVLAADLFRIGIPAEPIAARWRALANMFERLPDEVRGRFAPLIADIEQIRKMIAAGNAPGPGSTLLHGHVWPTPGRPTATIEIQVTSALDWRPGKTATITDRTVEIVEVGTTRPGAVVAGSLVRLELAATPIDVARSGQVDVQVGDDMIVILLDEVE